MDLGAVASRMYVSANHTVNCWGSGVHFQQQEEEGQCWK